MGLTLNVLRAIDGKLFDGVGVGVKFESPAPLLKRFPNGGVWWPSTIDSQTIFDYLCFSAGSLKTIYHSPGEFKPDFKLWFNCNYRRWGAIYSTMCYDYNPISNYDRTEEWTDTNTAEMTENGKNSVTVNDKDSTTTSGTETSKNTSTGTESGSDKTTVNNTSTGTNSGTSSEKVAAFDSSSMVARNTTTNSGETNTTNTGTTNVTTEHESASSGTAERSGENSIVTDATSKTAGTDERSSKSTHTATRTGRASGNIGVTTTQEMIEAEREVLKFDFLEMVAEEYKKRFCILVY